jgi:hypothetical protein
MTEATDSFFGFHPYFRELMFDELAKRWQSKKLQIQDAQIFRNEAYKEYAAMKKDAAQRRSWMFCEAIMFYFSYFKP